MIAILLFAGVLMAVLVVFLARYSAPPTFTSDGDDRPEIPPNLLRLITAELFAAMGYQLEKPIGDESSLVALRDEPLGQTRYVVTLAPVADQATILAAAENLRGEGASRGLLISPHIEAAGLPGLEVPLEIVDGPKLRGLIARHLPARLSIVDRYRGFGRSPRVLVPRPA